MQKQTSSLERQANKIVWLVLAFVPLIGMAIDLLAPALPAISHSLNISAAAAKNLISIYFLGFALANIPMGILADAVGRRKLVLAGLLLFALASFLPMLMKHFYLLMLARFLQGLALATFAVLVRAIISDVVTAEKLPLIATLVATTWSLGPIMGPNIGGYLEFYFGWQACFYFFGLVGLLAWGLMFYFLPETLLTPQPLKLTQIKANFVAIIKHRLFMGLMLIMGLNYALIIVFHTMAPFFIQLILGYSAVYFGHLALGIGVCYLAGTMLCRRLLKVLSPEKVGRYGLIGCVCMAFLAFILTHIFPQNIWALMVPSLMIFGCGGLVHPAYMGIAMGLFRQFAASASSIMNIFIMGITGLSAFMVSLISVKTATTMVLVYGILLSCSLIGYWVLVKRAQPSNV